MIGREDSASIRNVLASAEDFDIPHRVLDESALSRDYPQHRALPGEVAVLDEWAGFLRPEFAVLAAATVARSRGARVITGETVTRLEPVAGGVRVHAGDRTWTVEQVVVTAGPWTNRFVPTLSDLVLPNKLVMTWYHPRGSVADYLPDAFPIFIREIKDVHIFGIPTLDGGSVKVAPHASYGEMRDADELDRNVPPADLERINAAVADLLPGLVPTPVRVATYMDAYTPDDQAIVGAMPGVDNVWVLGRLLRARLQDGARVRTRGRRPRHDRQDVVADRAPRPCTLPDLTSLPVPQVRAGFAGFTGSPCRLPVEHLDDLLDREPLRLGEEPGHEQHREQAERRRTAPSPTASPKADCIDGNASMITKFASQFDARAASPPRDREPLSGTPRPGSASRCRRRRSRTR